VQAAEEVGPAELRHAIVDDRELRLCGERELDGLLAVAGRPDDFEPVLREQRDEHRPHRRVVVGYEAAEHRLGHADSRSVRARPASTSR
jgi:hypothetical protein